MIDEIEELLYQLLHSMITEVALKGGPWTPDRIDSIIRLADRTAARSSVEQLRKEVQDLRDAIADVATKIGLTHAMKGGETWDRPI